jgi:hypothetical protein
MILTHGSYQQFRGELEPLLDEWQEEVVPNQVTLLPHNRYAPAYAWMFSYEKRLKYRIEELLGQRLREAEPRLFGADGVLSEALSNAFVHGHGRDPDVPILVATAVGRGGLAFSVRDRGPGFDVGPVLARLRSGGGHFRLAGNGLRTLDTTAGVRACFADGGRVLELAFDLGLHPCCRLKDASPCPQTTTPS